MLESVFPIGGSRENPMTIRVAISVLGLFYCYI